jgi:hypothetical protein
MRKEKLIGLLIGILILFNVTDCKAQLLVEVDEFGVSFIPQKCIDTLVLTGNKGEYKNFKVTIYLSNCKGESLVKVYDKKNVLRAEGKYSSSFDTLKRYNIAKEMGRPKAITTYQVRILEYLRPLKIGKWIYYDKNGKIEYQTEYDYKFLSNETDVKDK